MHFFFYVRLFISQRVTHIINQTQYKLFTQMCSRILLDAGPPSRQGGFIDQGFLYLWRIISIFSIHTTHRYSQSSTAQFPPPQLPDQIIQTINDHRLYFHSAWPVLACMSLVFHLSACISQSSTCWDFISAVLPNLPSIYYVCFVF